MPRGIDLSKFRGDSDSEDEAFPPVKKQIVLDSFKQQTFSHGIQKKTKKELEKEEEERKRKQEEVDAAKAYKEFEDFFAGDDAASAPRGGTRGPAHGGGRGGVGGGFVKAGGGSDAPGQAYVPSRQIPTGPSSSSSHPYSSTRRPRSPSPPALPKPKGKRAMDSFLEEIKREERYREEKYGRVAQAEGSSVSAMAAMAGQKTGMRTLASNSETTNLYISNLPQGIGEDSLGNFFAKYGPVGAVKIMWPRGDEDTSIGAGITSSRRSKAGLSGFVAYMRREDAEVAVRELDGLDWGGSLLRVGWSKMVRIPSRPLYDLTSHKEADRRRSSRSPPPRRRRSRSPSRDREHGRDKYDDRSRTAHGRRDSPSRSRSPPRRRSSRDRDRDRRRSPSPEARPYSRNAPPPPRGRFRSRSFSTGSSSSSRSRSRSPARGARNNRSDAALVKFTRKMGEEKEKFVRAVADRVRAHGNRFEQVLRDRERDNEKFAFLRNVDLPEYHFYRYCLDSRYRLPTPPPDDFADEGKADLYSSDSAEDSERERMHRTNKGRLGKMARRRLEAGLRAMTGEREQIARLMEFAVNHADAVDDVADVICQSLRIEGTAVPRKLARLYLISDILHNSSAMLSNVWRYRDAFEKRLPDVMEHMADVHRSLVAHAGKLSGETFKSQVAFVIEIWENWIVFRSDVTDKLRSVLDGAAARPAPAQSSDTSDQKSSETTAQNEQTLNSSRFKKASAGGFKSTFVSLTATGTATPAPAPASDQAVPVGDDEDLDGEAMDQDLDGEAMDEDLDGEAMDADEDLDGEAM